MTWHPDRSPTVTRSRALLFNRALAIALSLTAVSQAAAQSKDPWPALREHVKRATYKIVVNLKEAPAVPEEGTAFVVHVTGDEDNPTVYLVTAAHVILGPDGRDQTTIADVVSNVTVHRGSRLTWSIPLDTSHIMIPERWESTDRDFAVIVIDHFGGRVEPLDISKQVPRVPDKFEVFGIPVKGEDAQLVQCQVSGALGTRPRRMLPALQCSTDHGMSGGAAFGTDGVFGIVHGADAEAREIRLFAMAALVCPYAAQFVVDWPDCFRPRSTIATQIRVGTPPPPPPLPGPFGEAVLHRKATREKWIPIAPAVKPVASQNHDQNTSILGVHIEPKRFQYQVQIETESNRRLSNPRLTCVSGACPWTQKLFERVVDGKIAQAAFDAWGSPTSWTLIADQEQLQTETYDIEEKQTLIEGRYLKFRVPSDSSDAIVEVELSNGVTRRVPLGESMPDGPLLLSHKISDGTSTTFTYIVSASGFFK